MQNKIIPSVEQHVFERPIPGQSLTNSSEEKRPWEQPPEKTTVREATQEIFLNVLKDENLTAVTDLMANETPIEEITKVILMSGYEKGKFNPDLMLQLIEPTMYILLAVAERVGIRPVLDRPGEAEDEPDDEFSADQNKKVSEENKKSIGSGGRFQDAVIPTVSSSSVDPDMKKKLADLDVSKVKESILQKQRPVSSTGLNATLSTEAPTSSESLSSEGLPSLQPTQESLLGKRRV